MQETAYGEETHRVVGCSIPPAVRTAETVSLVTRLGLGISGEQSDNYLQILPVPEMFTKIRFSANLVDEPTGAGWLDFADLLSIQY